MKKSLLFLLILLFVSCKEVINKNLSTNSSKLVIEASFGWIKGASGNLQTIKMLKSYGYYESEILKFTGAKVYLTDTSMNVFKFIEETNLISNTRRFTCNNFIPSIGETYVLTIIYNGQTYTASEKLLVESSIIQVEQEDNVGLNNDEIRMKVSFNNISDKRNYYLTLLETSVNTFPENKALKDEFSQENTLSALYCNNDVDHGN
jgi:hypothetical protein